MIYMKYRLGIFSRLIKIDKEYIIIFVWYKRYKLYHNWKVIYNLEYSYKKLLIKWELFLWNKQIWDDLINSLEKIWFIIPIWWNNVILELKTLHDYLSWPISYYQKLWLKEEISIFEEKSKIYSLQNNINISLNNQDSFLKFLSNRKTKRNFINNNWRLNLEDFLQIWFRIHSVEKSWILLHGNHQSAWWFYDIYSSLILFKEINWYDIWIYEYNKYLNKIIFKKNFDNRNKWYIKESLNNFYNINWILVIIWDLTFITKKYSYRSYIYQLIEVWEILQNSTIYSMSKSLNISAFGWFIEEELKNIIKIRDNSIIYSVIIF